MKLPLVLALMAVLFAGCTTATNTPAPAPDARVTFAKPGTGEVREIPREALVGSWYGLQPTQDGTQKEWITRRAADGTFEVRFRDKKDGRIVEESHEVGEWGLSYDYEIVITRGWIDGGRFRPAPPDAYFWDLYRLEKVDRDEIVYLHHGTGHRYTVHRVADDFDFPAEPAAPATPAPGK